MIIYGLVVEIEKSLLIAPKGIEINVTWFVHFNC